MPRFSDIPLFLQLTLLASLAMYVPALHALNWNNHHEARAFFYCGTLGFFVTTLFVLVLNTPDRKQGIGLQKLIAIVAAYVALPVFLAFPFYEALQTTSYLNAYFEMVSAFTTTGMPLFEPGRLSGSLHLWRGMVGWLGGLFIWISAAAILAPLALGGFEITASAEPGGKSGALGRYEPISNTQRLRRSFVTLTPLYIALTGVMILCLIISGDDPLVATIHGMSTMSTSGISPVNGLTNSGSGLRGEVVIFLFMLFALSRLTFSADTITTERQGLHHDPEFRMGVFFIMIVTTLLFLRHWLAALEVDEEAAGLRALMALWGSAFTVLSFLTTTGFESVDWQASREWSGLGASGLILLGLALIGGGVATTAGGVKLLRVYALYLQGVREMERLIHPSSVGRATAQSRRIRRNGAYVAWIFFMLFALSLSTVTVVLAAIGSDLEEAIILSIASLSTTGPLTQSAAAEPIALSQLGSIGKSTLILAMIVGRLETLAFIAMLNPALWRD